MSFHFDEPSVGRRFWADRLASPDRRLAADDVDAIVALRPVRELISLLASATAPVRLRAAGLLRILWAREAGPAAEAALHDAVALLETGRGGEALSALTLLIREHPDFAEARQKRALVRFLIGDARGAATDCRRALDRNPLHFCAWKTLALALASLGHLRFAARAAGRALALTPHDRSQRDLKERLERACSSAVGARPDKV